MSYKGFSKVELRRPTRSTFDLGHEKRLSTRMGKLTPVLISETMPNDTFYGSTEVYAKLAPLIAPIFHRLNLYVHYFFVPNRLLWEDWETFITGGRLGAEVTTPPIPPRLDFNDLLNQGLGLLDNGSWADYLGVPRVPDSAAGTFVERTIDAMPFGAVYKIYEDYYRDRNYEADTDLLPMPSGYLTSAHYPMLVRRYRCWEHDYFTSAQTSTQRGAEVLMPLAGSGTVTYMPQSEMVSAATGLPVGGVSPVRPGTDGVTSGMFGFDNTDPFIENIRIENVDEVILDSSSVSINDLRRAVRLQEWLERNQLAGSRYNESIMAHFGRKTSDSRLQRAEYIGGGKAVIKIDEVMTTAYSQDSDDNTVPPANMSGKGAGYANTNRFNYNCEEHGFIVGILSVMPTSGYMQGLPRMFQNRNTFLEYPWPSFAHLGEQEVYDNEIYLTPASMPADRTTQPLFGYQSRYADWKNIPSSSHGDFRTTLDYWHLTRKFSAQPDLGLDFVHFEDSLQDRVFNVSGVDTLWLYIYNDLKVKRSLPYFGTPML